MRSLATWFGVYQIHSRKGLRSATVKVFNIVSTRVYGMMEVKSTFSPSARETCMTSPRGSCHCVALIVDLLDHVGGQHTHLLKTHHPPKATLRHLAPRPHTRRQIHHYQSLRYLHQLPCSADRRHLNRIPWPRISVRMGWGAWVPILALGEVIRQS